MLENIHPKYRLSVYPKDGTRYNPLHDYVAGSEATIIDVQPGRRGWIAYMEGIDAWHRVHTSEVQNVTVDETGNVEIETLNTVYKLAKYETGV